MTQPTSIWTDSDAKFCFPTLKKKLRTEVLIVGAGITGLTAAHLLKKSGKKVIVIDHSTVMESDSFHTTAHLTEILDERYHSLISNFGLKDAGLVATSARDAIAQIEAIIKDLKISCEFKKVSGYLYSEKEKDIEELKQEFQALKDVQCKVRWVEKTEDIGLTYSVAGAIEIADQAQFHVGHYLKALALEIPGDGSFLFENTRAVEFKDGEPCEVKTSHGIIEAENVFVATHSPSSNKLTIQTKIASYRSYVLAMKVDGPLPHEALYWDMEEPYHYIRQEKGLLLVGGEDHKTGKKIDTFDSFDRLKKYSKDHFDIQQEMYRWSGQVIETVDGLPYIGKSPLTQHHYLGTGYSGNGMTFGTIAGMMMRDFLTNQKNPYESLYSPKRIKPVASAVSYISENKDFPICFLKGKFPRNEVKSLDEIQPGDGKQFKIDGKPAAVYRDPGGKLHAFNLKCPHMGCPVSWNSAEETWDCPCHGGRFDCKGKMLNGPAKSDLEKIELN